MPSTDVAALIAQQLDNASGTLALWIDEMPVTLQRRPGGWFYHSEITLPVEASQQVLDIALRLTPSALAQFGDKTAALCLNPQNDMLTLILRLSDDRIDHALVLLESICNQCEVWQDTLLSVLTQ